MIERAHRATGLPLSIAGDSGGPVYLYYGGNVTAVGIISGGASNQLDPSHNPSDLYYVPAWWNFPIYNVRIYRP